MVTMLELQAELSKAPKDLPWLEQGSFEFAKEDSAPAQRNRASQQFQAETR